MKKIEFIFCVVLFAISCSEDDENRVVDFNNVVVTGNLLDQITDDNIYKITHLTISGIISGEDWNILSEMARMGSLEELDMTNAQIVGTANVDCWNDDEIPEYEFSHSKTLKKVFLPHNLKVIGEEAFSNCSNLTTVYFPEEIDSIAPRAFHKSGLSGDLYLPRVRVIARQAFSRTDLTKVTISSDIIAGKTIIQKENVSGDSTDYISIYTVGGNSVFAYCEKLLEVVVEEGCTKLEVGFQHCTSLSKVVLPSTLLKIGYESKSNGNYIFKECSGLTDISLPDNLLFIGDNTFAKTSLHELAIPDNVQHIGSFAFHKCDFLEKIKMPKQLKRIDQGCFEGCTFLTSISIPPSVTEVESSAFKECSSLKTVFFGGMIKVIGRKAFSGCTHLQSVILPSEVTTLMESAFEGCSNLLKVVLPNSLEIIESTTFKDCIALRDLTIGNSVSTIKSSAFFHCPKLETLTLPNSIIHLDSYAFAYSGLRRVEVSWETPLSVLPNVFGGINLSKVNLIVPFGKNDIYRQAEVWKDFGTITEK